ncbi:hypothetical protein [Streptomyces sp. NBC_01264]|uniref:hypothetical protein n=1 Tax=Streptomyces sp. NBC_01264 TaxID=2903804 RepID=UPI002253AF93|nr:hypothetical protein [Streptomyces sp. NBC_01264]MCX4779323.1 hypothetical protein [Streptomyces sp. NBC_01264]
MRLKSSLVASAAALATVITPLVATPAAAAPLTTSDWVSAPPYYGSMSIGWRVSPLRLDPIKIVAEDHLTDGYTIGIRLVTWGEAGKRTWTMRTVPAGQTHAEWTTYLDAGWIEQAMFQVCKINARGVIASCEESRIMHNPINDDSV